jgi:uncharacterized protein YndB with AHSA1/START domain
MMGENQMDGQKLIFEQYIQAPISQIYLAFTNSTALREWLCDIATVDPKPDGRIYLAWDSGYYTSGEYKEVIPDEKISFYWRGKGDPGRSSVDITIEAQNGGARLRLEHTIPDETPEWQSTVDEIQKGWRDSLENLASTLETGLDLRFVRRPMLGIQISDFNQEIARSLGVPVDRGLRLDVVSEGMGAELAGLISGDVIVGLDGFELGSFGDLRSALSGKRAGDQVQIDFYRGPERMETIMELSQRSLQEVPTTRDQLAMSEKMIWEKECAELDLILKGITELEASRKPAANEWNVKEILAHLLEGERHWQHKVVEIVSMQESWIDDWAGNPDFQVQAIVAAIPTFAELLESYKSSRKETIELYAHLPEEFVQRKIGYWRIAFNAVETPTHFDTHLDQIRATIALVKDQRD